MVDAVLNAIYTGKGATMIDITSVLEVHYGENKITYVYQDHTDKSTWYLVPVPALRTVGSLPAFAIVKYVTNTGGVAGICTFEVELIQPDAARAAAEKVITEKYPGMKVVWGGFTWVGGVAYFNYNIEEEVQVLAVEPSLYGTNVASFQVPLLTEAALNTFINAFSGEGASPFGIEYEMLILTNLLGAKATVKYNAQAAITYQQTYKTEKNIWGQQKQILQETKQLLRTSGAGDVKVEIGAAGTPELAQRVRDWAWKTLEDQVANTIAGAAAMAVGTNPVETTSSFEQTYEEDAVVSWSTPVSTLLEKFPPDIWRVVYKQVDNRRLYVTFKLIGQLTDETTGKPIAESVAITVNYPGTSPSTFELIPANGARSTHTYEASGDFSSGDYNPWYEYEFQIIYNNQERYRSPKIRSADTIINLTPSNFGTRQVKFIGKDIRFTPSGNVQDVSIDFFFAPPEGSPAVVETKTITSNGEGGAVTFSSFYKMPIGAAYNYRLRYLMANSEVITSEPPIAFSSAPDNTNSGNTNTQYVNDPRGLYTQFDLRVNNLKNAGENAILLVDLNGQYFDTVNDGEHVLHDNSWSGFTPEETGLTTAMPPWTFQTVQNNNTAYFNLDGTVVLQSGDTFPIDKLKQSSTLKTLILTSGVKLYPIDIFTNAIDWSEVANVNLTVFQRKKTEEAKAFGDALPDFLLKSPADRTALEAAQAGLIASNVFAFNMLIAPKGDRDRGVPRFYTAQHVATDPQIEFFYTADYVLHTGEIRKLADQAVTGQRSVTLPPVPPAGAKAGFVRQTIDPALFDSASPSVG